MMHATKTRKKIIKNKIRKCKHFYDEHEFFFLRISSHSFLRLPISFFIFSEAKSNEQLLMCS